MTTEQDTLAELPLLRDLTFREWHGLVDGFYSGARWGSRGHEYSKEQHYWRTGYLIGTALRYTLVAIVINWLRQSKE